MSYLEKLLDGADVAWKPLGEVCDFKNGFAFKSNLFRDSGLPIIRITNVDGKNINLSDVKYFNPDDYRENTKSYEVVKGDILIAMSGAMKIGFYDHKKVAYLNQRVGKFLPQKSRLNNRYLYHYLLSKMEAICVLADGGAPPNLSSNALMAKIPIPIPCPDDPKKSLAIQAEIVRILDAFTSLTAELTAELTARKKQYNYYRDQLLTFSEDDVAWLPLGEIGTFVRGNGLQKKDFTESGAGCIHYGQIYTHYGIAATQTKTFVTGSVFERAKKAQKGDLIIADTSENDKDLCKAVVWLGDEDIAISNHTFIYTHSLNPKYVSYFFQTEEFHKQKRPFISGTKVRSISTGNMAKIKIPIPCPDDPEKSLAEQARIVNILDKFDALTNSIQEGLPREIELRQKQYNYYRDLLLSFPEPGRQ